MTLTGVGGTRLSGNVPNVFDSPNFPRIVTQVYIKTSIPFRNKFQYIPRNEFTLFLDFSKPAVLNFTILPSLETQNESIFEVNGRDATWVNGVFNEFVNFISQRPSSFSWFHRHSIWDVLLWIVGFPISFWLCAKLSPLISTVFGFSKFIEAASYFYIFIIMVNVFRVIFHYGRWIWPLVEYQSDDNRALRHRITIGALILGIVTSIIYDIIKLIA